MPDPYEILDLGIASNGKKLLMNARMKAAFDTVSAELGFTPTIVQGAYMAQVPGGGADESAGYHDRGGCLDVRTWDLAPTFGSSVDEVVRVARSVGWAAWLRNEQHGGFDEEHMHWVLLGDLDCGDDPKFQMRDYRAGGNGLSGLTHAPDFHPRPDPIPTFSFERWLHGFDLALDDEVPGIGASGGETVGEALQAMLQLVGSLDAFDDGERRRNRVAAGRVRAARAAIESLPESVTKGRLSTLLQDVDATVELVLGADDSLAPVGDEQRDAVPVAVGGN